MNIHVFKKILIKRIVLIQSELYLLLNLVFIILLNDYTSISYISIASKYRNEIIVYSSSSSSLLIFVAYIHVNTKMNEGAGRGQRYCVPMKLELQAVVSGAEQTLGPLEEQYALLITEEISQAPVSS